MPTPPPDATKAAGAARPAAAALQAVGGQVPIVTVSVGAVPTVATKTGKVVPETLFVATVLSQPATAVATSASAPAASGPPQAAPAVQPQPNSPSAVLQTAPLAASAVAIPPTVSATKPLENSQTADAAPRDPRTAPAPMAPQPSAQSGTAAPSAQPAANLAPAGLAPAGAATAPTANTLQIDASRAESPTPIKPAPALANGMATQFGTNTPSDGHAKPGTQTATSATAASTAGTPTANAVAPQTATAVAPPPPVQPPSDDPKAKLATPDSPVVNAAVPAGGPHTTQAPTVDAIGNAKAPVPTPPVFDQVAVHVAKAAADGLDKINIKLKPATLGHIEVHLEVASNGHVHAVIAADKPETLDLLQRDARSLERALGDAGLRTDSGSLSFNLRGQGQQYGGYNGNHPLPRFSPAASRPGSDIALPSDIGRMNAYLSSRAAAGGVDIRV